MVKVRFTSLAVVAFCASVWTLAAAGGYRVTHEGRPGLRHAIVKRVALSIRKVRHLTRAIPATQLSLG